MGNEIFEFEVKTGRGTIKLAYQHQDLPDPSENICNTRCPYRRLCEHLPDPENMGDTKRGFLDFCSEFGYCKDHKITEISEEQEFELINSVPIEGTLELAFKDWPEFKEIFDNREKYEALPSEIDDDTDSKQLVENKSWMDEIKRLEQAKANIKIGTIYNFEVETDRGPVKLVRIATDPKSDISSCASCSYQKICKHLPNPREMDSSDGYYSKFCGGMSYADKPFPGLNGDPRILEFSIPVDGSLEETFKDWPEFTEVFNNREKYESGLIEGNAK